MATTKINSLGLTYPDGSTQNTACVLGPAGSPGSAGGPGSTGPRGPNGPTGPTGPGGAQGACWEQFVGYVAC
jgi:hypothetical protein